MKFFRRSSKNRPIRRLATAASFAALLCASPFTGRATTRSYIGPNNGFWTNPVSWSPNNAPGLGDDVVLGTHSAGTTDLHVIYDFVTIYDPTYYVLNSLTLNSSALNGYMIVDQNVANSVLTSGYLSIGTTVNYNTWNQSEGQIYSNLVTLGDGAASRSNFYNLSNNGKLDTKDLTVGNAGGGTFNQTGGKLTLHGTIVLGATAGSTGTYNMSDGDLIADNDKGTMNVGPAGTGLLSVSGNGYINLFKLNINSYGGSAICNVTGGGLTTSNGITIGGPASGGKKGAGTLNLSGGSVEGAVTVMDGGTFNLKAGGTHSFASITVSDGGLYSLQGGQITSAGAASLSGTGEIRLNGNSVTLGGLDGTGGIVRSNAPGNVTLTLNAHDFGYNSGASITNGTSGVVSLVVTGSGSQTLSGTYSYTGNTTVTDGGTLIAGRNNALPIHTNLLLSNGGTFDAGGHDTSVDAVYSNGGNLRVDGAGTFSAGASGAATSFTGKFFGNGNIYKVGTGQWSLNVPDSPFNGTINVSNGNVVPTAPNSLPPLATFNVNGGILTVSGEQTIGALTGPAGALVSLQDSAVFSVGNNNTDSTYLGKFTSDGTVQKIGTGTFTLGGGASDTASTLSGTGAASFIVANGTLALNKALGTNAIGGPLTLTGGTVSLARGQQIADSSPLTINGGTFKLSGNVEIVGHLAGSGGTLDLGGGTLTVTEGGTASVFVSTVFTGGGTFIKNGTPSLTLYNTANSGGTFVANNGYLYLQGASSIVGASANNGGVMNFVNGLANLNGGSITSNAGGYVQYFGATINNAYLRGSGSQVVVANGYPASTFNNVTSYNSATLTLNNDTTLNNFTNGGTLNVNNATALFSGGLNTITGNINVRSSLATTDFGTGGLMTIYNGGALNNTGSNLVAGGGSRTTVNSGGLLSTVAGTSIELNGALLVNNGTQTGKLNVNYGSTAKGTGTFGTVNVTDGGRFGVNASSAGVSSLNAMSLPSFQLATPGGLAATTFVGPQLATTPAANNVASLTLGSGSVFAFNLQNAGTGAGTGYDLVHAAGVLTLSAGTTVGNQITVGVFSLAADGTSGAAANFNPSQSYQFVLVQADGGVTGFVPGEFVVDATGFQNSLNGGQFSVQMSGNNLVLAYNAVPEPGTWAIIGLGSMVLGYAIIRRRNCDRSGSRMA